MRRSKHVIEESIDSMKAVALALKMGDETQRKAEDILKTVLADPSLVFGRSYIVFETGALVLAGRGTVDERPSKEIIAEYLRQSGLTSRLSVPKLNRAITIINKVLGNRPSEITAENYIDVIISQLGIRPEIRESALAINASIQGSRVARRYPRHLAAALIYMASEQDEVTQARLATVAGTTDVTIRATIRDIKKTMTPRRTKRLVFVMRKEMENGGLNEQR